MSMSTRSLFQAIVLFEQEARFTYKLTRQQIAEELWKLRRSGREFAREELLRNYQ